MRRAVVLLYPVVFAAHVLGGFLMFRGRHLGSRFCDSDAGVFLLPALAALAAYFTILRLRRAEYVRESVFADGAIAVVTTALSFATACTLGFNAYGA